MYCLSSLCFSVYPFPLCPRTPIWDYVWVRCPAECVVSPTLNYSHNQDDSHNISWRKFFMLNVKTCVICKCNMAQLITRPQLDLRSQIFWTIFSAEYRDALFVPATFIFTNYNLKPEYKSLWLLELRRLKEKIFAAAKCQRLNFFLLILHFAIHVLPPHPLINCLRWATV